MPIADDLISELLRAFHITPLRQAQNDQEGDARNSVDNNAQNGAQIDQQNVPEHVQVIRL